jgi:hypothetical protein
MCSCCCRSPQHREWHDNGCTRSDGRALGSCTLTQAFDAALLEDARVAHGGDAGGACRSRSAGLPRTYSSSPSWRARRTGTLRRRP